MSLVSVGRGGELMLPADVVERYDLRPDRRVRLVETRGGLLLVPLDEGPMNPALAEELEAWQALGTASWDEFPYEDDGTGR